LKVRGDLIETAPFALACFLARLCLTLTTVLVAAATTALGGEVTELEPYEFVAVTVTRIAEPMSAATGE
jgi:hypothetical protein